MVCGQDRRPPTRELANTVWAFAKVEVRSAPLFAAIAAEAVPRLGEFNAQPVRISAELFFPTPLARSDAAHFHSYGGTDAQ